MRHLRNWRLLIMATMCLSAFTLINSPAYAQETKLTASDAGLDDLFGISVAISGDVAIVGAFGDERAGFNPGGAYIFSFDGTNWIEEAKLTASDPAAIDDFGSSVAISGDVVIVGDPSDDDAGERSGLAYIFGFDGTSWNEEAKLTASEIPFPSAETWPS